MKLLFLSYHYPGPFEPLARWLAARGDEILFASIRSARVENINVPGIRRVIIKHFLSLAGQSFFDILDNAIKAAKCAFDSLSTLKENGFEPEIIFTALSNGSALAIPDVFPKALWVNFLETNPGDKQNLTQILQILEANQTYAFYPSQKSCLPEVLFSLIKSIKPLVDTGFFSPPLQRKEQRLAVFKCYKEPVASALTREFLSDSELNRAVIIADNIPALRRLRNQFDKRVEVTLANAREERKELFRTANMTFFDYPCLTITESMACGCPAFVSPNVPECDRPENVLVYSGTEISRLLNNPQILQEYGEILRATAVSEYNLQAFMPDWFNSLLNTNNGQD